MDLREDVARILTKPDPDFIGEEMEARADFRSDLNKLCNAIADKIAELESLKRRVREQMTDQKNDIDKLERQKFLLLHERKKMNV
jgi:hypothetical protein